METSAGASSDGSRCCLVSKRKIGYEPVAKRIENIRFIANHFIAGIWTFAAICVTIIAAVLSKKILADQPRARILYIAGMAGIFLGTAYRLTQAVMKNEEQYFVLRSGYLRQEENL